MTRKEIYDWCKTVFSKDYFDFDDSTYKITAKNKINWDQVDGLKCLMFSLLSSKADNDLDVMEPYGSFYVDNRFIKIDKDTIKINDDGELYVDVSELADQQEIVSALMKNPAFVDQICERLAPDAIAMDFVKKNLLTDSRFVNSMKAIMDGVTGEGSGYISDSEEATVISHANNI